jgi:peroxiredoxin
MESERRRIGEVHRSIHLIIAREGAFDASVTDDGACDHLPGLKMPSLVLPSTAGRLVDLSKRDAARTIVYCYSMTGVPGAPLPEGWDLIPGARGCIPQACAFRDHYQELATFEAELFGLSTQPTDYQREMAERLRLPFEFLSDEALTFANALKLPTFEAGGMRLIKRLTLIIRGGRIETVLYPVFPSYESAAYRVA